MQGVQAPCRAFGLHAVLTAQGVQSLHQDVGTGIFQNGWMEQRDSQLSLLLSPTTGHYLGGDSSPTACTACYQQLIPVRLPERR